MPEPLNLTGREQEFFAEVCSCLRSWWFQWLCNYDSGQKKMMPEELADRLEQIMLRFGYSPQDLDRFYDLMHRTGANV
jgi:hypothetical protein